MDVLSIWALTEVGLGCGVTEGRGLAGGKGTQGKRRRGGQVGERGGGQEGRGGSAQEEVSQDEAGGEIGPLGPFRTHQEPRLIGACTPHDNVSAM